MTKTFRRTFAPLVALLALAALPALAGPPSPLDVRTREQNSATGSMTTSGSDCSTSTTCVSLYTNGAATVAVNLAGFGSATVQFEGSIDNGTTYVAVKAVPAAGGAVVTSATGNGQWLINASGFRYIRTRCSATSSATIVAWLNASPGGASAASLAAAGGTAAVVKGNGTAGSADSAPITVQGIASMTPVLVQPQAASSGGGSAFYNDAVTTVVQIKASAGQLYSLSLTNTAAATSYLQVFCKPSASVTLGTTGPDFIVRLKTNAGAGDERDLTFPVGICAGGTGLSVAGTTTATGSSTAAVSVSASYN